MRGRLLLVGAVWLAACSGGGSEASEVAAFRFPPAPAVDDGALTPEVGEALEVLPVALGAGALDRAAVDAVVASGDARLAWLLGDLMRLSGQEDREVLSDAFERLTGVDPRDDPEFPLSSWRSVSNHLIAWDLPAFPGYREAKGALYLLVEPAWEPFFADTDSEIDWRLVAWGGVRIDDRPLGDPDACPAGCIPALDDPELTDAAGGDWYPDDAIVFAVVEGDDAVAFPKNIMEVHELVNITIGGRRFGIPYCTLCGSAQAYYTDSVREELEIPVLRTSGLLSRSNKVMYDLNTASAFDTFTGAAVSGPLHEAGVTLDQATVVTSTWGEWKRAHPDTRIVARDGGIGRVYRSNPLGGRDDDGPIFPIGPVDERLPVQELVVGVITDDGTAVAFPSAAATAALADGRDVELAGIELRADGAGLRAFDVQTGAEVVAHEAFWFAWSQFHPGTEVWSELSAGVPAVPTSAPIDVPPDVPRPGGRAPASQFGFM